MEKIESGRKPRKETCGKVHEERYGKDVWNFKALIY